MKNSCPRCHGLVLRQYDVDRRLWERYCLVCGARPDFHMKLSDGRPQGAELLCRMCKINPRSKGIGFRIDGKELETCVMCRVQYLAKRRVFDMKRRKRMGNVRYFGALDI